MRSKLFLSTTASLLSATCSTRSTLPAIATAENARFAYAQQSPTSDGSVGRPVSLSTSRSRKDLNNRASSFANAIAASRAASRMPGPCAPEVSLAHRAAARSTSSTRSSSTACAAASKAFSSSAGSNNNNAPSLEEPEEEEAAATCSTAGLLSAVAATRRNRRFSAWTYASPAVLAVDDSKSRNGAPAAASATLKAEASSQ
mmetsp:Transcript_22791/g.90392  ORF Transcript_22791/g.90392 Transcript_22791/m.90392 type:complete len:201 (+) Transcript_22791:694-1296(+)